MKLPPGRLWRLPESNHGGTGPDFEIRSEPEENLGGGVRRGEELRLRRGRLREKPRQFETG